jgi:hypothetical protein
MVRAMCSTSRLAEVLDLVVVHFGVSGTTDVQALAAARLEEALEAEQVEHLLRERGRFLERLPADALAGIEVEDHAVGLRDVGGGRVPGVQLDHVHLRRAGRAPPRLATSSIGWCPGQYLAVELDDAGNGELLAVLLEEELAADARGRAHQRDRAPGEVRKHVRRDRS